MRKLIFLLALVALAIGLSISLRRAPVVASRPGSNVILVSIDTLRADRLGVAGYHRPLTAAVDSFREDAVFFRQAFAAAPSTLPSHASILSSLLPVHHQAYFAAGQRVPPSVLTLAEVLRQHGYSTLSFNGGGQLDRAFGIDQGFDRYESHDLNLGELSALALDAVDQVSAPFFLFLHTYQVHHPYEPSPDLLDRFDPGYSGPLAATISDELLTAINQGELPVDDADLRHIEAAYDAEVFEMDFAFQRLLDSLRERDLYDDALIVFTSDHGEEFSERGWVGWHSHTLYDELLHVPLIVKFPEQRWAGSTVAQQVRSVDIAPTILAHLGLEVPQAFVGKDLRPLAESFEDSRPTVAFLDHDSPHRDRVIRLGGWKLYLQGEFGRLFELPSDPSERSDVASDHPLRVAWLRWLLNRQIDAGQRHESARSGEIDEATEEQLKALGYVN